jgi:hypothetical protein
MQRPTVAASASASSVPTFCFTAEEGAALEDGSWIVAEMTNDEVPCVVQYVFERAHAGGGKDIEERGEEWRTTASMHAYTNHVWRWQQVETRIVLLLACSALPCLSVCTHARRALAYPLQQHNHPYPNPEADEKARGESSYKSPAKGMFTTHISCYAKRSACSQVARPLKGTRRIPLSRSHSMPAAL